MPLRHAAMLEVNEFLVLDFVREQECTTRPEIGRALELSPASVSRIVARLLHAGLVVESGLSSATGGRPAVVISFNRRAGAVIAVDLGATRCEGALADLSGELLYQEARPTREQGAAFPTLLASVDALRAEAKRQQVPVAAVAVGVPAILDPDSGLGVGGPNVEWDGFEVVGSLAARLEIPFVVENDVNLAALAHAWRGEGRRVGDFVTFYIGTGVGGAVVANGRLVKGRHNAGGEVGYLVVDPDQLHHPLDHGLGGLESLTSGPAIVERARVLLGADDAASVLRDSALGLEAVFDAAGSGDPIGRRVVQEVLDHVGMALVALAAVVDPALIILDGPVGRLLEPHLDVLAGFLRARHPLAPRLVVSRLRGNSTLIGAVAAALQLARQRTAPAALFGAFDVSGSVSGGT